MANLQTGNRRKIVLMGHINTDSIAADCKIEADLHRLFNSKSDHGEWFELSTDDVIAGLKRYSNNAYITIGNDAFEILSYDRDGVPEYASPWLWNDVDVWEFCPSCGWACGWTYSENWGGLYCIECGASERNYDNGESGPGE